MWCCCESSVLLCKRVVLIFMRVEVCLGEVIYGAVVLLVRLFRVKCVSCRSDRHRHICLRTHTVFPDLPKTENKMPPKSNSAEQINRGRGTRPNPAAYKIRQKKKQTFLKRHQTSLWTKVFFIWSYHTGSRYWSLGPSVCSSQSLAFFLFLSLPLIWIY